MLYKLKAMKRCGEREERDKNNNATYRSKVSEGDGAGDSMKMVSAFGN